MTKALPLTLAAALLATGGAASAQSATDAQCIILSNAYAKDSKDANAQKLAQVSLYFYLGRVSDSVTPAQLKALLEQQTKTITDATAPNMMNACVKAIDAKVQMLKSLAPPPQKKPEGR